MFPFPEPEGVIVHHVASLDAVQFVLEVTLKLVFPAIEVTFWFEGVTDKVGVAPACVTARVTAATPVAETLMIAIRLVIAVFAV